MAEPRLPADETEVDLEPETTSQLSRQVQDEDALDAPETRSADGISVEIDTVAGPISIVRTTVKAVGLMQHC